MQYRYVYYTKDTSFMYTLISLNRLKSKKKQQKTIPHCWKSPKIQYKTSMKRQTRYPNTQVYDGYFSDLVHGLKDKSGGVKLAILKPCMQMFSCLP